MKEKKIFPNITDQELYDKTPRVPNCEESGVDDIVGQIHFAYLNEALDRLGNSLKKNNYGKNNY